MPFSHAVQYEEPSPAAVLPAGQSLQVRLPTTAVCFPGGHLSHVSEPAWPLYVPTEQLLQLERSLLLVLPAGQSAHVEDWADAAY